MITKPTYKNIHHRFRVENRFYSFDDLKEVAYSLIKEGVPFEQEIGEFLMDWLDDSPYIEVPTSGSTGTPKKIQILKQHMVNSALATGDFFQLSPGDSALLCLPARFIAGKMMLVRAMILGLELSLVAPGSRPLKGTKEQFDFSAMTPQQLSHSMKELSHIKKLIIGGAAIQGELLEKLQHKHTKAYATYGMTETVSHVAVKKLNHFTKEQPKRHYVAMPNVSFTQDDRGCLVITAPDVCAETLVTNDVVNLLSPSEFEWVGRFDNVINSGGIKLFPESIEVKLANILSTPFFITSLPDAILGERLILVVEGTNDTTQIMELMKGNAVLLPYEFPKEVYVTKEFKRTSNGKIQRKRL